MLSKKAKYAMHALVHLARNHAEQPQPIPIAEIAQAENIPYKFLEAILLELRKAGILGSKKGKAGGYYLLKAPEAINMAEIMRLLDGPIALLPCVTHRYYEPCEECQDEETCAIRAVFLQGRNTTVAMLKEATLTNLQARESALRKGC